MFKKKDDVGNMTAKIEKYDAETETQIRLLDVMTIYLGGPLLNQFKQENTQRPDICLSGVPLEVDDLWRYVVDGANLSVLQRLVLCLDRGYSKVCDLNASSFRH